MSKIWDWLAETFSGGREVTADGEVVWDPAVGWVRQGSDCGREHRAAGDAWAKAHYDDGVAEEVQAEAERLHREHMDFDPAVGARQDVTVDDFIPEARQRAQDAAELQRAKEDHERFTAEDDGLAHEAAYEADLEKSDMQRAERDAYDQDHDAAIAENGRRRDNDRDVDLVEQEALPGRVQQWYEADDARREWLAQNGQAPTDAEWDAYWADDRHDLEQHRAPSAGADEERAEQLAQDVADIAEQWGAPGTAGHDEEWQRWQADDSDVLRSDDGLVR